MPLIGWAPSQLLSGFTRPDGTVDQQALFAAQMAENAKYNPEGDPSLGANVDFGWSGLRDQYGNTGVRHFTPEELAQNGGAPMTFFTGSSPGLAATTTDPQEIASLRDDQRTRMQQSAAQIAALIAGGTALTGGFGGGAAAGAGAGEAATTYPYVAGGPVTVSSIPGVTAGTAAGTGAAAAGGILDSSGAVIPGTASPGVTGGGGMNFFQRVFGRPLGGTGGIAGGGQYPTTAGATPPFFPNASSGPKWLQMLSGGLNRAGGALSGGNTQNPNLSPAENDAMRSRMLQTLSSNLLMASGPRPKGTSAPLADLGTAMFAAQQAGDQFTADSLKARLMQAQIAQAEQRQGPEETADIKTMRALGYELTPDGFKKYNDAQARPGTTINIGKENEPIPINQLGDLMLPDGTTPPIGTTPAQAAAMGARVVTTDDRKRAQQSDQALGILSQLEEIAVGPDGVFEDVKPGLLNRAASAFQIGLDMLSQNDPRASQFYDMSQATLAPFIKYLGESGSLAQGDVQRAIGLLPRVFPLPDTKEVAEKKFAELKEIITRGANTKPGTYPPTRSEELPPLPPGFTLDPE